METNCDNLWQSDEAAIVCMLEGKGSRPINPSEFNYVVECVVCVSCVL